MQTHEWEALLDGTADGPWKAERHGNEEVISICTAVHDPKRFVGDFYGEGNARLAAVAPEAVAEVVRLRRAITDLRDDYLAHIATREFFVDQVSGLVVEIREDVDDYYGTAADDLTRILEGEEV